MVVVYLMKVIHVNVMRTVYPVEIAVVIMKMFVLEGGDGGSDVCSDSILLGDLNVDGIVNVLDVITVVNYVIGSLEDLSFDELCAADNNNDGIVNVLDIVAIVNTEILDN